MTRLPILPLAALLSGCFVVRGSGDQVEEFRDLGEFSRLENSTWVEVSFSEGDTPGVTLVCDDNLIGQVLTEVRHGTLEVKTPRNRALSSRLGCTADVVGPTLVGVESSGSGGLEADGALLELEEVENSGSGHVAVRAGSAPVGLVENSGSGGIEVEGVDSSRIDISNSGSGRIKAQGVADRANLDNSGSGGIDASALEALEANVENTGAGDVSLTVGQTVSIRLSGSGDVLLTGDATVVDSDDSGSGEIRWN